MVAVVVVIIDSGWHDTAIDRWVDSVAADLLADANRHGPTFTADLDRDPLVVAEANLGVVAIDVDFGENA